MTDVIIIATPYISEWKCTKAKMVQRLPMPNVAVGHH